MDLDDNILVSTPEGLELHLQLAGLGSRFIAGATDLVIQVLSILILALVTGVIGGAGGVSAAVFLIGAFAIFFFYPIYFEVLAAGRTPGKRWSHLRVVRDSGAPVDLQASAIRNLMRLIDGPLLLYLPTVLWIGISGRNQRPGDLAAGTIVIRDQTAVAGDSSSSGTSADSSAQPWDTSAVTAQETAAVRGFLERRDSLDQLARAELAHRLASGLRPKVTAAATELSPERFLEELERVKRTR